MMRQRPLGAALLTLLALLSCGVEGLSPLDRMTPWFQSLSAANKRLQFRVGDRGSGVYVGPKQVTVAKKDRVMAVPMHHVLSVETIVARPYGNIIQGLAEDDMIAAAIITEWAFGNGSKLEPWLSSLPKLGDGMDPPTVWPQDEVELIVPVSHRFEIIQKRRDAHTDFLKLISLSDSIHQLEAFIETVVVRDTKARRVSEALKAGLPDGRTAAGRVARANLLSFFTEDRIKWAHTLLDTRAWNLNGRKYFVPGADMFNHAPDSEDLTFDPLSRKLHRIRSQKFVEHHEVNVVVKGEDPDTRFAVVYSDRGPVAPESELFESYGDNTDSIYFTYHGFVPGFPERFVASSNASTMAEKKRLALAWRNERVLRNAWDCQLVPIRPAKWSPVHASIVGAATGTLTTAQLTARERLVKGSLRPPKKEPKSRALTADETAASDWFRERVFPITRVHSQTTAMTCSFYGELDPVLAVYHLVHVLPAHIIKSDCMTHLKVRSMSAKYHSELWYMYGKVLECANNQPIDAETTVAAPAWELLGLRALRASLTWHFVNFEFPSWFEGGMPLLDDALEIRKLLEAGEASPAANRRVMRLRFALERKMIAKESYRLMKRRMRDAKRRLTERRGRGTSSTDSEHSDL